MALYNPPQVISSIQSNTSSPTSITGSTTSQTLIAANTSRKGATIWNESAFNMYIEFGAVASLTAFTVKLLPSGYYEVPFNYAGVLACIWDGVNGNALVRELT
ncbi:MAG: hypothetical protein ACFKPT_13860 [Gloeotrichia echinulata GP01]